MRFLKIPLAVVIMLMLSFVSMESHADQKTIKRWSQNQAFKDELGGELVIGATYYASEYIEALVQSEAEKNLWTSDETEQYKYQLLRTLSLDEYIPIHLEFDNRGSAMHMAPFDKMVNLWIGKNKLTPSDYDKRFNFRLLGKRDGMIFFPRYDEKGKSYLDNAKTIRLTLSSAISGTTLSKTSIDFFWDVHRDNPEALYKGRAASRMELDRLIKRIEKLSAEKGELESKLDGINNELDEINQRVDELQKQ
ncbi:MAG: hypothetical protein ACOX5A_06525 [Aminivibrio sp.]